MSGHGNVLSVRSMALAYVAAALIAAVSLLQGAAYGQVSGISYTLTPIIEGISFGNDAALKNAALFGGKLGFGFGEFIELNGLYMYGRDVRTDLGGLSGFDDATSVLLRQLPSRATEFHRFGGELKFNIGRGALFPFIALGTGVVRFVPENLNDSKAIYLSGGLGVQYSFRDRYTIVAQASDLSYRYNPGSSLLSDAEVTTLGLTPDDFDLVSVHNLAGSVGVKVYLGGSPPGEVTDLDRALQDQLRGGWRGLRLRVEPIAAEIGFSKALGFREHQRMVGLSSGIDLGAYAGLRGFYWRGAEADSWTKFDDIQAYGGELKLAFSYVGGSLTPYVSLGGGYMDVRAGYTGNGIAEPEDRPFALGGIGLVLPLGNAVNIDASVRSVLMSTGGIDNVSDPGAVESSVMFTVGVSFGLGGQSRRGVGVFGREMATSKSERELLASEIMRVSSEISQLTARVDSLVVPSPVQRSLRRDSADVVRARRTNVSLRETQPTGESPQGRTGESRWMTLPVPEEGELYLRFGKPGGVSVETIEGEPVTYYLDPATGTVMAAVPSSVNPSIGTAPAGVAQSFSPGGPGVTADQLEEVVRRVMRDERLREAETSTPVDETATLKRLENMFDVRMTQLETQLNDLKQLRMTAPRQVEEHPERKSVIVETQTPASPRTTVVTAGTGVPGMTPAPSTRFAGLAPLTGYNLDHPHQGLIGLRADFVHPGRPFRVVPELVLGFGDNKTTTNVNLNGLYDLGFGILDRLYPYGGIGLGFLNRDDLELVLNLIIGSDVRVGSSTMFLEYVNQDFFDNDRLLVGYRFRF